MAVPVSQMYTVAKYVLTQKIKGCETLSARPHDRTALPL